MLELGVMLEDGTFLHIEGSASSIQSFWTGSRLRGTGCEFAAFISAQATMRTSPSAVKNFGRTIFL